MKIAVFCGSSAGLDPVYTHAARALGQYFAERQVALVYGGGKVGLMGVIADAVMDAGGQVYGVIPVSLQSKELAHTGLTELFVVADMHERKAKMAQLADAFVAMPGGAGTLEEIFESWTWAQLGYHSKPCAFYNVNGFYDPLLQMITNMTEAGFLKPVHANMLIRADQPEALLQELQQYQPPQHKWS
ncbi:LOG family protein [Nitrincola iocasae]|uniref:Cytokinin riboside 5'-monophosphate phosphoribohydrolase n=1 Tax=Nitrincola iocasae TaxID=2614693 RepID=A0A5J6LBC7_9GAMM|nr:TIGR00730 family Rossman fold protein [Nitrincola iocasae]QEW05601.1 TIGR00730 family Rossman fold protein [Nitrincola iocasae]